MKRISKILSVLMVVAMLFSIAVIPASAASDPEFTIKYEFRSKDGTTAINSAKAGDVVRLYTIFNWNKRVSVVGGGYVWNTTTLTMLNKMGTAALVAAAPATAAFTHLGEFALNTPQTITDQEMSDEDNTYFFSGTYSPYGMYENAQNRLYVPATWDDAKKANHLAFTYMYAADPTAQMPLINTKGEDLEVMYSYFKVNADTDDLSAAIIPDDAGLDDKIYIYYPNEQGFVFSAMANITDNKKVEYPTSIVSAPAAPSYDVYNLKGFDKTAPADKHSDGNGKNTVAVYFGLGMDPVVNPDTGRTTFITGITATVTVKSNGETVTVNTAELDKNGEIKYVYKVGEGYGFRVILQNVPDGADVTVTPAIVSTDSSAAYNIETVSFNVADAYARS